MSSDSSDNEDRKKIEEAVAPELMRCMAVTSSQAAPANPLSLRTQPSKCSGNSEHHTHLKTTPEFRDHLSKKLSKYLDSIVEVDYSPREKCQHSKINLGGVKLFQNSVDFLDESIKKNSPKPVPKLKPTLESDSDEEDTKFSEVAVSGNDILLGGKGVFAMENNTDTSSKKRHYQSSNSHKLKSKKSKKNSIVP